LFRQRPLLPAGDVEDPTLCEDPGESQPQRPSDDEIPQCALMKQQDIPAECHYAECRSTQAPALLYERCRTCRAISDCGNMPIQEEHTWTAAASRVARS